MLIKFKNTFINNIYLYFLNLNISNKKNKKKIADENIKENLSIIFFCWKASNFLIGLPLKIKLLIKELTTHKWRHVFKIKEF